MSDVAKKPFPSYLEMPKRLPSAFWWVMRIATFAIMLAAIWLIATHPTEGFALFWKVMIPSLPLLFAIAPGIWRQVCPMALLNQLPRTFGFSQERTLPVRFKNIAYFISVLLFFFLVSLRHVYFNKEPAALLILVCGALALAFLGGVFLKVEVVGVEPFVLQHRSKKPMVTPPFIQCVTVTALVVWDVKRTVTILICVLHSSAILRTKPYGMPGIRSFLLQVYQGLHLDFSPHRTPN